MRSPCLRECARAAAIVAAVVLVGPAATAQDEPSPQATQAPEAAAVTDPPAPPPSFQPPPVDSSAPAAPASSLPLAGWHDGIFYLRDSDDNFRLYVQGRIHADGI